MTEKICIELRRRTDKGILNDDSLWVKIYDVQSPKQEKISEANLNYGKEIQEKFEKDLYEFNIIYIFEYYGIVVSISIDDVDKQVKFEPSEILEIIYDKSSIQKTLEFEF